MCAHNFLTSDGAYATARRRKGRKKEKRERELERKEGRIEAIVGCGYYTRSVQKKSSHCQYNENGLPELM